MAHIPAATKNTIREAGALCRQEKKLPSSLFTQESN
jgi:hypothetical protein